MTDVNEAVRLFLVAPSGADEAFEPRLAQALSGGDVAAVLFDTGNQEQLVPLVTLVQKAGATALIKNDTRLAGHVRADGVHIEAGIHELRLAVESFRPKRIVGAGNLHTRHGAMQAGELDVDYVFFGRPHGDTHDAPHPKALELCAWWSEVMQVPAVMMAGRSIASVSEAAATGADFVAVNQAVWMHGNGPGEAVREALARLRSGDREAA